MKLYEKLKTHTEAMQQQMFEAKKNECANALKESLTGGQKKQ